MKWIHAINDYKDYLKIERGLSHNSIISYENDLKKLESFLTNKSQFTGPLDVKPDQIKAFVYQISKEVKANSQSRIISGIRSFYDYLLFEKLINKNPLTNIESPKQQRKLPSTLSLDEIDQMIKSIEKTKKEMLALKNTSNWTKLKAYKNNNIFIVDGNQYFNRPGPRILDSIKILKEIISNEKHIFGYKNKAWEKLHY